MSGSDYIKGLRAKVGNGLLLLPCVAAVLLNEKNELLLQQKKNGSWSLPAGMIEPGESPVMAVKREVLEETGFEVEIERVLGVFGGEGFKYTYDNGDRVEYTVILFKCQITGHCPVSLDTETVKLNWFAKSDFPGLALPYPLECLFAENKSPLL